MKKLIDANARIEEIKKAYCTGCENYSGIRCRACWVDDAIGLIDDAPAVEATNPYWANICKIAEKQRKKGFDKHRNNCRSL